MGEAHDVMSYFGLKGKRKGIAIRDNEQNYCSRALSAMVLEQYHDFGSGEFVLYLHVIIYYLSVYTCTCV